MDAFKSAGYVLPIVYATMGRTPRDILDIGCGDGEWLSAASALNVNTLVLGIDMKPRPRGLPDIAYLQRDLIDKLWLEGVLPIKSKWDLVICVEVAEHLHPQYADHIVWLVTRFSDTILWSAAHPGQGPYGADDNPGVHHNEQPLGYWSALFDGYGFEYVSIYNQLNTPEAMTTVDPWYRENACMFRRRP